MAERDFSPTRLEAISDGVIAVAITIMVLELHPPHDPTPAAVLQLWPQFASYVVSFGFIATYWVNHRYLFRQLREVNERVLWTNMVLLFFLSLIPFATAYAGQTGIAPFPTALYAAIMLANGAAYGALTFAIRAQYPADAPPPVFRGAAVAINFAAIGLYVLAIPAAYLSPLLSLAMNLAVSFVYMSALARPEKRCPVTPDKPTQSAPIRGLERAAT